MDGSFLVTMSMVNTRLCLWLQILAVALVLLKVDSFDVGITYLQSAVAKGAGKRQGVIFIFFGYILFFVSVLICEWLLITIFADHMYAYVFTVCLDGSPPAYHMSKGFGAGINNWLVHFEVGIFCVTFSILFCMATELLYDLD